MSNILIRMLAGFGLLILISPLALMVTWTWMIFWLPEAMASLFTMIIMVTFAACTVAWVFTGERNRL